MDNKGFLLRRGMMAVRYFDVLVDDNYDFILDDNGDTLSGFFTGEIPPISPQSAWLSSSQDTEAQLHVNVNTLWEII
jgi:hypothetical protein